MAATSAASFGNLRFEPRSVHHVSDAGGPKRLLSVRVPLKPGLHVLPLGGKRVQVVVPAGDTLRLEASIGSAPPREGVGQACLLCGFFKGPPHALRREPSLNEHLRPPQFDEVQERRVGRLRGRSAEDRPLRVCVTPGSLPARGLPLPFP